MKRMFILLLRVGHQTYWCGDKLQGFPTRSHTRLTPIFLSKETTSEGKILSLVGLSGDGR